MCVCAHSMWYVCVCAQHVVCIIGMCHGHIQALEISLRLYTLPLHAGVHTLAAVIFAERGDSARARTHGIKVLSLLPHALSPSAPDEILFGRAGYLFCLLFLRKHADGAVEISHDVLRTVFDAIITSGRVDDKTK